jgi:hypothetical protein
MGVAIPFLSAAPQEMQPLKSDYKEMRVAFFP